MCHNQKLHTGKDTEGKQYWLRGLLGFGWGGLCYQLSQPTLVHHLISPCELWLISCKLVPPGHSNTPLDTGLFMLQNKVVSAVRKTKNQFLRCNWTFLCSSSTIPLAFIAHSVMYYFTLVFSHHISLPFDVIHHAVLGIKCVLNVAVWKKLNSAL